MIKYTNVIRTKELHNLVSFIKFNIILHEDNAFGIEAHGQKVIFQTL